ncbi:hypothetical protein QR680_017296 [Steinernema hermaphroditum]|uniref:Uncharacterized protein n=1 Tax=Steinernema hermaphroditum TaxID=289476 RepID=A0AA39HGF2_9BILA|nr:hypothetical protein QR680_017296 [Steinernema hermaphroditum]
MFISFNLMATLAMPRKLGAISWLLICALLLDILTDPASSACLYSLKEKRLSRHAIIRLMLQRDAMKYFDSSRVHRSSENTGTPMRKRFIIVERPQKTEEDAIIEQFY